MDPFTALQAGAAIAGLVTQFIGQDKQKRAAKEKFELDKQISEQERAAEEQRRRQMQLNVRRQNLEIIRNNQRARSLATYSAVTQGAQFGSALSSGQAHIAGQTGSNFLAVQQNAEIGSNLFDISGNISGLRVRSAEAASKGYEGQGLAALGGSLLKTAPTIASLGRTGFSQIQSGFGGAGGQYGYTSGTYGNGQT